MGCLHARPSVLHSSYGATYGCEPVDCRQVRAQRVDPVDFHTFTHTFSQAMFPVPLAQFS